MVFRLLSVLSGLFFALAAHAQSSPVEGVDYIELKPPQAVESSGRIEVLEFFWYPAARTATRWSPTSNPGRSDCRATCSSSACREF